MSVDERPYVADFFEFSAALTRAGERRGDTEFPLREHVELRSAVSLNFHPHEIAVHPGHGPLERPRIDIPFLTLAGVHGSLPFWVTEAMEGGRTAQGRALHSFLDVLNRRFWELLFIAHRQGSRPSLGFMNARKEADVALLYQFLAKAPRHVQAGGGAGRPGSGTPPAWITHRQAVPAPDGRDALAAPGPAGTTGAAGTGTGGLSLAALWARGNGRGEAALCRFLRAHFGAPVTLVRSVPVRLPVALSARAQLGHLQLRRSGVLGHAARLACGVRLLLDLTHYGPVLNETMPLPQAIGDVLGEIRSTYRRNQPPLALRVALPVLGGMSRLGAPGLSLGRGAQLASRVALTQLVQLPDGALRRLYPGQPAPRSRRTSAHLA